MWGKTTTRRWRSHTFADGVHAITLTGTLDAELVAAVRARVRQLVAIGHRRLILDARRIDVTVAEARRVAEIFRQPRGRCRVVVVLRAEVACTLWLPAGVARAGTLAEARRVLAGAVLEPDAQPPGGEGGLVQVLVAAGSQARWKQEALVPSSSGSAASEV